MAERDIAKTNPPNLSAPLIEWALWHLDHGDNTDGYWITPIRPGEKAAYRENWSKEPLKSRQAVERHWKNNPNDNVGLVPRLGYFWLDADDVDLLEEAEDEHGDLPRTYTQRSINGNYHFLFRGDVTTSPTVYVDLNNNSVLRKLGEIRGAMSGQCVGAGSRGTMKSGKSGFWEIEDISSPADAPIWVLNLIKNKGKRTLKDARHEYGKPIPWDEEQAIRLLEIVEEGSLIKTYTGPFFDGERDK